MSPYDTKPARFLKNLHTAGAPFGSAEIYCAGFEMEKWRCVPFARHLIEWLLDYALPEAELSIHQGNAYEKLRQAAIRVYTSAKYAERGEAGEIALHAICRDFFETIPISYRVFHKSSTNDVIKAFDLVHVRFPVNEPLEIWLGESKLYDDSAGAIYAAISSIKAHLDHGFLENQKLLLGPQIPNSAPHYQEIASLFSTQSSIDKLLSSAVFVVGILANSKAATTSASETKEYLESAEKELFQLLQSLSNFSSGKKLRMRLIYVPLATKADLVDAFDLKLKGIQ